MTATLVLHTNPFRPQLDVEDYPIELGLTICQVLAERGLVGSSQTGITLSRPLMVLVNGVPVLQRDWNTVLQAEDVMQVAFLPRGGGGGSNIRNILTAIVIAVAAYFTFGLSLVATAAVGVAALAVLSLTGQTLPDTSLTNSTDSRRSPTYSLDAQGNQARLLQAMPRICGRMKTFPDLAAQPYSEYQDNTLYLYQIFCVSLGEVEIEAMLMDNVPIGNFEDAQYEVIPPNGVVTLFPDNVVTSSAVSNLQMVGANNSAWAVLGPFNAVPVGQKANHLAVDIGFPQGAQTVAFDNTRSSRSISFRFEYQVINDNGDPLSPWTTFVDETVTFNTQEAQVITRKVKVQEARYLVRGYRTSNEVTDSSAFDTTQWVGMRAYIQDTKTYGNCTLIATILKATNALNSSTARQFSVISTGKCPVWDPIDGWSTVNVATRNPIWWACDALMNKDYGRGLPSSRINITKAYQLAQTAVSRGDTFNAVFDSTMQLWDAVTKCLAVMRTVPMYYAGVIDFVRDEPQSIVKYTAGPAKMVMGSFDVTYNFFDVDTPDHVVMEFINEDTWETEQVSCVIPGRTALNPSTVQIFGLTDRGQAWREGIFIAACNLYRRKNVAFAALNDGLIPRYLTLARVSHDTPSWGYSGRCLGLNRQTGDLVITEPVTITPQVNNYIAFTRRNGSEDGPYLITDSPINDPTNGVFVVRLTGYTEEQLDAIYISNGTRDDLTTFMAGPSEQRGMLCLVKSAMPDNEGRVALNLINYSDAVHTAEMGGVLPAPPPDSNLPGIPSAPIIDAVTVSYTVTVGQQNIVATAARGAIYYEYEAAFNGGAWQKLGNTSLPNLMVNLSPGSWVVRVRAFGRAEGPWTSWVGTIEATSAPLPRLDAFVAMSKLAAIGLQWTYDAQTSMLASRIEVWAGVTDVRGDAVRLINFPYPANTYTLDNLQPGERRYFWARVVDTAERIGPWFNNGNPITQIAIENPDILMDYLNGKITEDQLTQELLDKINSPDVDLEPVYAAIAKEAQTRADETGALAEQVTTTTAIANGAKADAQIAIQSTVDIEGKIDSAVMLRAQATRPDGEMVTAGVAVGVTATPGEVLSRVLILANRFAVLDQVNGVVRTPFIVENGNVYISSAFIQKATIREAMIGATLTSSATIPSGPNQGLPVRTDNYEDGSTIYRGLNFTRVDNSAGTKMTDMESGIVVIEWGELS